MSQSQSMNDDSTAKLVQTIYRSLLDRFNPSAKQLISVGKSYLKAMNGAAAASQTFMESLSKLARSSQEGVWGGSTDIGGALIQLVKIQNEVQKLQENVLKAFFVDLIVPLEINLEKDTKAIKVAQKKFVHNLKSHNAALSKASSAVKSQRRRSSRGSRASMAEKEIRNMKNYEEKRNNTERFINESLKDAIKEERRRYGFVLERQCSLAKHYLVYYDQASNLLHDFLPKWENVSKTREVLPEHVEAMFSNSSFEMQYQSSWMSKSETQPNFYPSPRRSKNGDEEHSNYDMESMARSHSLVNLNRSMNGSRSEIDDTRSNASSRSTVLMRRQPSVSTYSRTKSDLNLNMPSDEHPPDGTRARPKSMVSSGGNKIVRALHSYLSSDENRLSFHEGDVIMLIGDKNKGWQFGENLRNNRIGWFPVAYTKDFLDDEHEIDSEESREEIEPRATTREFTIQQPTKSNSSPINQSSSAKIYSKNIPAPPPIPVQLMKGANQKMIIPNPPTTQSMYSRNESKV